MHCLLCEVKVRSLGSCLFHCQGGNGCIYLVIHANIVFGTLPCTQTLLMCIVVECFTVVMFSGLWRVLILTFMIAFSDNSC
jgi:hypothetical protein